jgi:hypothetical protein
MKKGVSLVFEHVLLFMIGIVIFLACFATFRSYELYFTQSITRDQFNEVSEWVVSKMVALSEGDEVNSTLRVRVPALLGNEPYEINLSQEGISVTSLASRRNLFSPLSSINKTFSLGGGFSTLHGSEFLIYKRGNQIIIG